MHLNLLSIYRMIRICCKPATRHCCLVRVGGLLPLLKSIITCSLLICIKNKLGVVVCVTISNTGLTWKQLRKSWNSKPSDTCAASATNQMLSSSSRSWNGMYSAWIDDTILPFVRPFRNRREVPQAIIFSTIANVSVYAANLNMNVFSVVPSSVFWTREQTRAQLPGRSRSLGLSSDADSVRC